MPVSHASKPHVLVVEAEFLIADLIREVLEEAGYEILGPYRTVSEAIHACYNIHADAAIVDLVLHGALAHPIADVLTDRGVPFDFAPGRRTIEAESASEQTQRPDRPFSVEDVQKFVGKLLRSLQPRHNP